jgi:catechol 2,3-dioxygenase-like lactoylglutathione lyase family enzyme
MFKRMDHVGISVKDMEKAVEFYRDVIGMEITMDREFDLPLAQITGLEGARARIVHMRFGESVVELFDYKHPQGRERRTDHRQADYGLTHIGFMVEDFQSTYQDLKAKGVKFLGEPVEIRPGVFVTYFYGAEGEVCEMREIT